MNDHGLVPYRVQRFSYALVSVSGAGLAVEVSYVDSWKCRCGYGAGTNTHPSPELMKQLIEAHMEVMDG